MKIRLPISAMIAVLLLSQPVFAWNDFGHMAVAWVCYEHLNPAVKQRCNALLKLNPMYSDWVQKVSPKEDKDEQIFMLAATWPDLIKVSANYRDDPITGPDSNENIGYADKNMHKYWHFVDYPYSQDHTPLPSLPVPNAEVEIPKFTQVISSNASDELKAYDLVWLLHIVGDIHQPLHTINRACKDSPKGDNGGNDIHITEEMERPVLHQFIDYDLGPDGPPDTVIPFAKTLGEPSKKLAKETDPSQWIKESHALAIKRIYRKPIGPEDGPYTLTDGYKRMIHDLCERRVELAGVRLANLLNQSLK